MDATFAQLARETGQPPRRRKRGGQPGNKNALTHGFYSKTFAPAEDRDIDEIKQISLDSEIDMLRVSIRRIFDLTAGVADPVQAVRYVHVLTRAVTSLDHLVVRQNMLHNTNTAIDESLREALDVLHDKNGERAADGRKRYAIQKAILTARLDKYVPPPPGTPPPPDPRTLPQPDSSYAEYDPFSRLYKRFEVPYPWEDAYGEVSPLMAKVEGYGVPIGRFLVDDRLGEYGYQMLELDHAGEGEDAEDDEEDEEDQEYEDEEEDLDDDLA